MGFQSLAVFSLQEAEYLDAEELARFSLTNSIFLQHMRFLAIILAVIGVECAAVATPSNT